MRIWRPSNGARHARLGVVLGVTAATVLATATPALAAVVPMTLSSTQGPSGGGNTITATTAPTTTNDGKFPPTTVVQFQYMTTQTATAPACAATYTTPVPVTAS